MRRRDALRPIADRITMNRDVLIADAKARVLDLAPDRRGMAIESTVSGGCIVSGSIFRSLLFSQVRVHSYSSVNWSVLLPSVTVGRRARLTRVVVDRSCHIPDGMVIGEDPVEDAKRFYRTDSGIVLVTRDMLAKVMDGEAAPAA